MSYLEAIKYLETFVNYEKKSGFLYNDSFKLERIAGFLKIIGDPQNSFKVVHVAGTKGKGSVCAFAAYILREAGYKTGLFTSPHLLDVRERLRVLEPRPAGKQPCREDFEGMILQKDLAELIGRFKNKIDKYCANSKYGPLSFFEVYTILAFVYFKEREVDFAVLETGLGGRLDATNSADPDICGITSISYDHTDKLGNTLGQIAQEKAGIIKKPPARGAGGKLMVVSAPQEEEVLRVLRDKCLQEGACLYEIGKDIRVEESASGKDHQAFNIRGNLGKFNDLKIYLAGRHQVINAALAVSLVSGLFISSRENIRVSAVRRGLADTRWPGRFEQVWDRPPVILDGAHNGASARVLADTLRQKFADKKITLILGISADKNAAEIAGELFPLAQRIILTCSGNPRAARPQDILAAGEKFLSGKKAELTTSVHEALKLVRNSTVSGSLVVVTGSLFVVGDARAIIKNVPDQER